MPRQDSTRRTLLQYQAAARPVSLGGSYDSLRECNPPLSAARATHLSILINEPIAEVGTSQLMQLTRWRLRGNRRWTRDSSQFREDSSQCLLETFVAVPLENGRLGMFSHSPQGFVCLHVTNGKMKLPIVLRILLPQGFGSHWLETGQAYLEYQVGLPGSAYQFVASP